MGNKEKGHISEKQFEEQMKHEIEEMRNESFGVELIQLIGK